MKDRIIHLLELAMAALKADGTLPADLTVSLQVERTKDRSHGDFASNLAMMLAKPAQKKPRDLAAALIAALPADDNISKAEIAGPGFINFFQADDLLGRQLSRSEEHTSELQSRPQLVCRLLLEKKKNN